jgi:hypothetical protein
MGWTGCFAHGDSPAATGEAAHDHHTYLDIGKEVLLVVGFRAEDWHNIVSMVRLSKMFQFR